MVKNKNKKKISIVLIISISLLININFVTAACEGNPLCIEFLGINASNCNTFSGCYWDDYLEICTGSTTCTNFDEPACLSPCSWVKEIEVLDHKIELEATVNGILVAKESCSFPDSNDNNECKIIDLTQKSCCWGQSCGKGGDMGGHVGKYLLTAIFTKYIPEPEILTYESNSAIFSCFGEKNKCNNEGVSGDDDEACIKLPGDPLNTANSQGNCVQNSKDTSDYICRPTKPYKGDDHCAKDEKYLDAVRRDDLASCPSDITCGHYICDYTESSSTTSGCATEDLPAEKYPKQLTQTYSGYNIVIGETYPDSGAGWNCDNYNHCNGIGDCVDDCYDPDGDGYGSIPDKDDLNDGNIVQSDEIPFFVPEACTMQDPNTDCIDDLDDCTINYRGTALDYCQNNRDFIYPSADELCNAVDDDCDGTIDEGCDDDLDGYADISVRGWQVACPLGYNFIDQNGAGTEKLCDSYDKDCVDDNSDCDDEGYTGDILTECQNIKSQIYPGAIENCNSIDDDCDGTIDEGCDDDLDGYADNSVTCSGTFIDGYGISSPCSDFQGDCNDGDFLINPGENSYCDCNYNTGQGYIQGTEEGPIVISTSIATDYCFDGIDNNCNSLIDCLDTTCSPNNYFYQIRNRTCGVDFNENGDCTPRYDNEPDFDRACCPNPSDCVINGVCVQSGDIDGTFPETHYCSDGEWFGGDIYYQVCETVVDDTDYPTISQNTSQSLYNHWGLPGNAGNKLCCGDDINEYYTVDNLTSDPNRAACCSKKNMYSLGGNCIEIPVIKDTWDKTNNGFCIGESQCMVNPNILNFDGTFKDAEDIDNYANNNIRCINDGEFIGDHYCSNGEWASRTSLIAASLIDLSQGLRESNLFCDSYDNVLNYYGYNLGASYAEYYLGIQGYQCLLGNTSVPCTNNICVLKYKQGNDNKIIIGTSLNHDINSPVYSILEVLGSSNNACDSQLGSTGFGLCATTASYNDKIKSIIYSPDSITPTSVVTANPSAYMNNYYSQIFNYVKQNNPSSYDYGFVTKTQDFNKIYINNQGDKRISIITEEINNQKHMTIEYSNFKADICNMIDNYANKNPQLTPLDCTKNGAKTYVTTGGLGKGYYDLLNDLGPKLRIE